MVCLYRSNDIYKYVDWNADYFPTNMPKTPPQQSSSAKPARHCNKCPNRPLRIECIHTKAGLAFLSSVGVRNLSVLHSPKRNRHPIYLRRAPMYPKRAPMYPKRALFLLQVRNLTLCFNHPLALLQARNPTAHQTGLQV
jgi:hypothetical protein